jgi:hypothetical protein
LPDHRCEGFDLDIHVAVARHVHKAHLTPDDASISAMTTGRQGQLWPEAMGLDDFNKSIESAD